ncbi:hypothetical protein [Carnobacterium inhibens]|uniref:Uncharacterized protein n=1 Tax=Carnobacterium inhibens subsp. gilichinskyi TaxID=1266845 RepID=U5SC55_9LACT|nr:hypothetical protein [Carnobacterium inhibens]AGY82830.1 hypothetical protein Q783_06985 [Carnobacterium inhibens subsp. gilichinskyi]
MVVLKKIFTYFMFSILFFLLSSGGSQKYVILLFIVYLVSLYVIGLRKKIKQQDLYALFIIIAPSITIVVLGLISMLINRNLGIYNFYFKNLLFLLLPPIFAFLVNVIIKNKNIDLPLYSFFSIAMVFFVTRIPNYNSIDLLEGTEAFIFGLYILYFMMKKKKILLCLAIFLTFLAHKRIVIASVIVCMLLYIFLIILKKFNIKKINTVIFCGVILIEFLTIYVIKYEKLQLLKLKFDINDMGRSIIYSFFDNQYSFSFFYKGNGLGFVDSYFNLINSNVGNLHSDILKIYIEVGFIGFLIFNLVHLNSYIKIFKKNNREFSNLYFVFIIYVFINYFSDNALIYIYFLVPLYLLIFYEYFNNTDYSLS